MMTKPATLRVVTAAMLLLAVLTLAACGGQASTPAAEAPAAELATEAAATEAAATEPATEATEEAVTEATAEAVAEAATEDTVAAAPAAVSEAVQFQIVPEGTEARFLIDEVLMGQDKTVVGATSAVSGQITVDPANPQGATIGEIRVDASTLVTDDNRRTGRLQNDILRSSAAQYQYIVFQPTAISGLPAAAAVGEPFTFQVTGDLTILDTSAPVTFDMTVTPVSDTELMGSGTATVRYADFGINIPSVPIVAGVADEVRLEIDFTALASS
jgi:polyisoprenoid-binding protein YceI